MAPSEKVFMVCRSEWKARELLPLESESITESLTVNCPGPSGYGSTVSRFTPLHSTPMVTYAAACSQSPERAIQQQAMKIQYDPQLKRLDSGSFPHWGAHFLDVLKPRISPQKLTCTNERLTSEKESLTAANAWSLKLTAESETRIS
jgi:hypothetical protein